MNRSPPTAPLAPPSLWRQLAALLVTMLLLLVFAPSVSSLLRRPLVKTIAFQASHVPASHKEPETEPQGARAEESLGVHNWKRLVSGHAPLQDEMIDSQSQDRGTRQVQVRWYILEGLRAVPPASSPSAGLPPGLTTHDCEIRVEYPVQVPTEFKVDELKILTWDRVQEELLASHFATVDDQRFNREAFPMEALFARLQISTFASASRPRDVAARPSFTLSLSSLPTSGSRNIRR
ncbi:hypothetical protein BGW38_002792 [Lunasporangiospora selenospora]|uniref:Uncharacterized protein n=1 Tax=Lunasporangiospora selenospora TaxID=979761 RepID=A0A9P6FSD3_9FUNG|nr:hypothetical protein BGW38_002792 [Lunasporangiospora selenospora]